MNGVQVRTAADGVAVVEVGTGRRANALSTGHWRELARVAGELDCDPDLRAVVVRGAADGPFGAGSDLREWADATPRDVEVGFDAIESALVAVERLRVPTIAAVTGVATGAACQLACACDLRVVGTDAALGMPIARWGILVPPAFVARLMELTGLATARELLYTGRLVRGAEAQRIGLANVVVDAAEIEVRVHRLVHDVLDHPFSAVRAVKRVTSELGAEGRTRARVLLSGPSADYPALHQGVVAFLGR